MINKFKLLSSVYSWNYEISTSRTIWRKCSRRNGIGSNKIWRKGRKSRNMVVNDEHQSKGSNYFTIVYAVKYMKRWCVMVKSVVHSYLSTQFKNTRPTFAIPGKNIDLLNHKYIKTPKLDATRRYPSTWPKRIVE